MASSKTVLGAFAACLYLQVCLGGLLGSKPEPRRYLPTYSGMPGNVDMLADEMVGSMASASSQVYYSNAGPSYPPNDVYMPPNPAPTYMETYIDNSAYNHIVTSVQLVQSTVALFINSLGILPASFNLGSSPPTYVKLLLVRKNIVEVQEYLFRLINILTTDLVQINAILCYIPGYSLAKWVVGIPVSIVQKVLDAIHLVLQGLGFVY